MEKRTCIACTLQNWIYYPASEIEFHRINCVHTTLHALLPSRYSCTFAVDVVCSVNESYTSSPHVPCRHWVVKGGRRLLMMWSRLYQLTLTTSKVIEINWGLSTPHASPLLVRVDICVLMYSYRAILTCICICVVCIAILFMSPFHVAGMYLNRIAFIQVGQENPWKTRPLHQLWKEVWHCKVLSACYRSLL